MSAIRFRIHLIYRADGMTRPISFRQIVPANSVREALRLTENFIGSAYVSGFTVLTWTAENMDLPVTVKYAEGQFAEEINGLEQESEQAIHSDSVGRHDAQDRSS